MTSTFITIFLILLIFFANEKIKNLNLLSNYRGYKHQKFSGTKKTPLSGGLFLICSCLILFYINDFNHLLSLFLFFIFCIGFISDINLLSSPKLRFLIQFIIIVFFVILLDIKIHQTKFHLIDILLKN